MIAGHYSPVFDCLQLPLHAEALREDRTLPTRSTTARGLWECISGPLRSRRFVGGLLPDRFAQMVAQPWWPFFDDEAPKRFWRQIRRSSPFILARPLRFLGVEEHVFNAVLGVAQRGLQATTEIEPTGVPEQTGSLSLLRDGTVLGPADYFEPVDIKEL